MVDLSCDRDGQVSDRLLDLVLERSGLSYGACITAQPVKFRAGNIAVCPPAGRRASSGDKRNRPRRCALSASKARTRTRS